MDSDSESDMRKRGEEAVEEEDEKEGQMTDPETGEEDIASGEAGTGSKVKGLSDSESDEEPTFKTGSNVKSEGPLESSSDEEVSKEVMEYGERSDSSRKIPLAAYGDTGRARERERKLGRTGRRAPPLVRVHYWKPYVEVRKYLQEQSSEDRELLRQQEKEKEQESDPEEGPSGRIRLKNMCKSVLLDRPDNSQ